MVRRPPRSTRPATLFPSPTLFRSSPGASTGPVRPTPLGARAMPRRMEIELTSARDDGGWTWRAAGAKAPKGTVDGGILPGEAKVGDVLRVEADFFVDGIQITSVVRSEEHTSELQSLMRISYAVFCLKKKTKTQQ